MGLDMYLMVGSRDDSDCKRDIGYWRRAYAIHDWFVENVQDGKDDCGTYEVTEYDVKTLLRLCKLVAETFIPSGDGYQIDDIESAELLLPSRDLYDDWYTKNILHTIEVLDLALAEVDFHSQVLFYSSSW